MPGLPSGRGVIALVGVDGMPHLPRPAHPGPRACPSPAGILKTCPSGEDIRSSASPGRRVVALREVDGMPSFLACQLLLAAVLEAGFLATGRASELGFQCGRYWDRTSDLFGVNADAVARAYSPGDVACRLNCAFVLPRVSRCRRRSPASLRECSGPTSGRAPRHPDSHAGRVARPGPTHSVVELAEGNADVPVITVDNQVPVVVVGHL